MNDTMLSHLGPIPWALQRARVEHLSWAEKLALIVLWGRAKADGRCFTAFAELAKDMPASKGVARTAVRGLEAKGLVNIEEKPGRPSWFVIHADRVMCYLSSTPIRTDSPIENDTPTETDRAIETDMGTPIRTDSPPLSELIAEEVPIRNTRVKKNPSSSPSDRPPLSAVPDPTETRAAPQKPAAKKREPKPKPHLAVSPEFRQAMATRFAALWSAESVSERIEGALNWSGATKWRDCEQGVRGWLTRDAERAGYVLHDGVMVRADGGRPNYQNGNRASPPASPPTTRTPKQEQDVDIVRRLFPGTEWR